MPTTLPPDDVLAAILADASIITRRVDIYEEDSVTPWMLDAPLIDGNVSVDITRDERRQFDLTLENLSGELDNYPGGFWYDKVIKIFRGVMYPSGTPTLPIFGTDGEEEDVGEYGDGTYGGGGYGAPAETVEDTIEAGGITWNNWEVQLGEFLIDEIGTQNFPHTVGVKGRDRTKQLLDDTFNESTTFVANTPLVNVVRAVALNGGVTRMILPSTSVVLSDDFSFEAGDSRWKALTDLCEAFGFEIFFDAQGYLVMREFRDPLLTPPVVTFGTGAGGNLVSYKKTANDTRLYNAVRVTGQGAGQLPVSYTAENNDPSDPTSIPRLGRRRVFPVESAFISTIEQCQDLAEKLLAVYGVEAFQVALQGIVLPWLEGSDILRYVDPDPNPGDPSSFLISDFAVPLKLGAMPVTGKRVVIVQ